MVIIREKALWSKGRNTAGGERLEAGAGIVKPYAKSSGEDAAIQTTTSYDGLARVPSVNRNRHVEVE